MSQKTIGSVERLDDKINNLIASDAVIEVIAEGFSWAEGPLWVPELNGLLFTDVPENKMYLWKEAEGLSVYLDPSGYMLKEFSFHLGFKMLPTRRGKTYTH